jgi:hypothetical protein
VTADLPTDPARLEQFIVRHFEGGGREDVAATFEFAGTFLQAGEARFSAGEVINYTVYAASGVVNSIAAVPSAAA